MNYQGLDISLILSSAFILGSGEREITLPQSKELNNRLFRNWLYGIFRL